MLIEQLLSQNIIQAFEHLYKQSIKKEQLTFQKTRKEFEGDITLLVFPLAKLAGKSPDQTANELGNYLQENMQEIKSFNVVKGFLNILLDNSYWSLFFNITLQNQHFGFCTPDQNAPTVMVEYCSPNTNKPIHLGHVRNILLGWSVAEILKASGRKVMKVNLVNDRGIHICKSMLAWQKWGNGETPESTGIKGDHLVGKYYVEFSKHYGQETKALIAEGMKEEEAEKKAPLMLQAQELLRKWEAGDKETVDLWKTMNAWVYQGFDVTYKKLNVDFDKIYHESNTYLLGKKIVDDGLQKKVFFKKEDGSVWIDLSADGLDQKLLLRSDGTSVYMTQDLGTAVTRHKEFPFDNMVYVVGNEQEYHFKVLRLILQKLGHKWADNLYHLSYGMVELPEGKMKSREGTVVDADDLIEDIITSAKEATQELGKMEDFDKVAAEELYKMIGLAALKYFILKVDPKKKMLFNPKESIDLNGHTGPFIQYTHARIQAVLRKANEQERKLMTQAASISVDPKEKELLRWLHDFPGIIQEAAQNYSPALLANYVYELAKSYNQFYHDCPILKEENTMVRLFRLQLSAKTGIVIKDAMNLLGIQVPEKM